MPNHHYTPLPPDPSLRFDVEREEQDRPRQASGPTVQQPNDPRFNPPTPSPLKRAGLLLFVFFLFWLALRLRTISPPPLYPVLETNKCFSVHSICIVSCLTRHRFPTDFDYRPAVNDEGIKNARSRTFAGRTTP